MERRNAVDVFPKDIVRFFSILLTLIFHPLNQLTDQNTRSQQGSQTYANIVGAGSGTLMLIIAKEIPDTYWFKSYLIMTAPSISVYLSNVADEIKTYIIKSYQNIKNMRGEKKIIRKINALKKYPDVTEEDINLLNKQLVHAKIQYIKRMIDSLKN